MESLAARNARLGRCNGFDALRLFLAIAIVAFHSYTLTHAAIAGMVWQAQVAARLILPAFFVISGYLVATSVARCDGALHFLTLRALRILPALTLVVLATALVVGPLLTALPLQRYFADPSVVAYLQNIAALPHFTLPGLFDGNPRAGVVNGALWTIPLEVQCYLALAAMMLLVRGGALTVLIAMALLLLLLPLHASVPAADFLSCFAAGALAQRLGPYLPMHRALGFAALAAAFWLVTDPARLTLAVLPLAYGILWLGTRRLPAALTRADYSYGLYLCAFPLQQTILHLTPAPWWLVLALSLPLGLGLAALLWHGVERPILSRKHQLAAWGRVTEPALVPGVVAGER